MVRRRAAIGPRFVTRFQCTGPACPESCCSVGWSILVDEGHYRRLKRALGEDEFRHSVRQVEPEQRSRQRFALLVLKDDGACRLLDERGLCTVHARFGAGVLCDTCAIYPRSLSVIGHRREMSLALSCPEAARLALLFEDATDLVELLPGVFPDDRVDAARQVPRVSASSIAAIYDQVRGTAIELLQKRTYPMASRLAFTLLLADRLQTLFASPSPDAAAFTQALEGVAGDSTLEALHDALRRGPSSEELPAHFCVELLGARLARPAQPSFLRVALAALQGCDDPAGREIAVAGGPGVAPLTLRLSRAALLGVHQRRRAALPEVLAERLEVCFENFAKAHWFDGWFPDAPSVVAYAQVLVLRVALLRFLVLGHPRTAAAVALCRAGDETAALGELDAAVVDCVFGFSRAVEHQTGLVDSVMQTFETAHLTTLQHGLSLLRF